MQDKTTGITALGLVAILAGTLGAACGRDDYYIVYERTELRGTERVSSGGGCTLVLQRGGPLSGTSSGTVSSGTDSSSGDLSIDEGNLGEGYRVVVSSQGEELARRNYDRPFLLSHDVDIFEVTTHAGKRIEFLYRGSSDCDLPPPQLAADAGASR
ncbi:MAG: hypothetical protein RLZZ450_2000 [Pseudomonadota bacterium]|jgi:hypothetical protein